MQARLLFHPIQRRRFHRVSPNISKLSFFYFMTMSPADKIAIIGHNGWAAQAIVKSLAAQAFTTPLRVLARDASSITSLPDNVEVARYSWDREESIASALYGIDILLQV